jgi:hypothetical protein
MKVEISVTREIPSSVEEKGFALIIQNFMIALEIFFGKPFLKKFFRQ